MYCRHCGYLLEENSQFCSECGQSIEAGGNTNAKVRKKAGIGVFFIIALLCSVAILFSTAFLPIFYLPSEETSKLLLTDMRLSHPCCTPTEINEASPVIFMIALLATIALLLFAYKRKYFISFLCTLVNFVLFVILHNIFSAYFHDMVAYHYSSYFEPYIFGSGLIIWQLAAVIACLASVVFMIIRFCSKADTE